MVLRNGNGEVDGGGTLAGRHLMSARLARLSVVKLPHAL